MQVIVIVPLYVYDSIPIISDREESYDQCSELYRFGVFNNMLSVSKICEYFTLSSLNAGIFFALMYVTFNMLIGQQGFTADIGLMNLYIFIGFTLILIGITIIETTKYSIATILPHIIVSIICIIYVCICNFQETSSLYSTGKQFFQEPILIISVFLSSGITITLFYIKKILTKIIFPSDFEHLMLSPVNKSILSAVSRVQSFENNLGKVYQSSDINKELHAKDFLTINPFLLNFNSPSTEKIFIEENSYLNAKTFSIYMEIYSIVHIVIFFYSAFETDQQQ